MSQTVSVQQLKYMHFSNIFGFWLFRIKIKAIKGVYFCKLICSISVKLLAHVGAGTVLPPCLPQDREKFFIAGSPILSWLLTCSLISPRLNLLEGFECVLEPVDILVYAIEYGGGINFTCRLASNQ